jgi:predicted GIY-YIG superfamily endonuclease
MCRYRSLDPPAPSLAPLAHRRCRIGTVYLLHFARPYYHARHYLGFTTNLEARLAAHRRGRGSPLVSAAVDDGIEVFLARTWTNVTVAFERRGHRNGMHPLLCPVCRGPRALRWYTPRRDPVTGIGT